MSVPPCPCRCNSSASFHTLCHGKWPAGRRGFKNRSRRLSAERRTRSKAPAHGAGDAVTCDRVREQLPRLLAGEEVADVQPPATSLVREARVAVAAAGGALPARTGAARAVVAGAAGDEQPLTDQPLPRGFGDPRRAAAEARVVPVAHRIGNRGHRQRPAVEPGERARDLLVVVGRLLGPAHEIVAAHADGRVPGAAEFNAPPEVDLEVVAAPGLQSMVAGRGPRAGEGDRKSTRLNSSHSQISYAVFCLKKKRENKCSQRADNQC